MNTPDQGLAAILQQLFAQPQGVPGQFQMTQNDNAPGAFDPVAAVGARGAGSAFYNAQAMKPHVMNPRPRGAWEALYPFRPVRPVNDDGNFFGR